jgi:hypothetical protein
MPAVQPSPVQAGLTELAQAVELLDEGALPPGRYAYTRSEQTSLAILPGSDFGLDSESFAYLLPSTREVWRDNQGNVQLRFTNHSPTFFSSEVEAAYYRSALDRLDQINETVTFTATGATSDYQPGVWSTDSDLLRQQMLDHVHQGGSDLPDDVQVLNLAGELVAETGAPPSLRAAILRVLSTLDLEPVEQTPDRLQLAVTHQDSRYTVTFDEAGKLIEATEIVLQFEPRLGIPAGTIVYRATYQPTVTIDQLP